MCGILAVLNYDPTTPKLSKNLVSAINNRGPDFQSVIQTVGTSNGLSITLRASVLQLMGDTVQTQPVIDDNGNILLFNGQVYKIFGRNLEKHQSDTKFLSERLKQCQSNLELASVFSDIDGPFAFVYWSNTTNSVLYGRDFFGRKSLCQWRDQGKFPVVLSSLGFDGPFQDKGRWTEVDCLGIHCYDFSKNIENPKPVEFTWNLDSIYPPIGSSVPSERDLETEYVDMNFPKIKPLNSNSMSSLEYSKEDIDLAVTGLEKKLIESIKRRLFSNKTDCLDCRAAKQSEATCSHSKIVVAFSGGLDSTVIALALHKLLDLSETIDLTTVAFKNDSPDRESVGLAFKELSRLCPERNWRLILSDISIHELKSKRAERIRDLINPCNTVVDDSLGCGCWFISRAKGRFWDSRKDCDRKEFDEFLKFDPEGSREFYSSPASIMFAGMGIDEQLGGYSSHRSAYSKGAITGLYEEISRQMRRISSRNLGRDDRCCSDHSRDVKLPFLDFEFVSYLNELPVGIKMNLNEPTHIGPKKLLRLLAARWGLTQTGYRVKRALQFGTRIANLENPKETGNQVCHRLLSD